MVTSESPDTDYRSARAGGFRDRRVWRYRPSGATATATAAAAAAAAATGTGVGAMVIVGISGTVRQGPRACRLSF